MPAHRERTLFSARTVFCAAFLLAVCMVYPVKSGSLSPGLTPPGCGMGDAEKASVLLEHNRARERVGVGPLVWNPRIADMAGRHAERLARTCRLEHSGLRGYGENLFMGTVGFFGPADGIHSWIEEGRYYDHHANSGHGMTVGHYTQVVWRETTDVGCGQAVGCGNLWMVCNYSPPGNYIGRRPY